MDLKLEQVTVHSRDIFARYIFVKAGQTLTYSIKPERNSIFFGVYKKHRKLESLPSPAKNRSSSSLAASLSFQERIRQADLEVISERRKLPGGKVFKGCLTPEAEGMYAIVLDNTFSKQKSKLVTFIVQVCDPTELPLKNEPLLDDDDNVPEVAEEHLTGILLKKRRKKLQGWAKRFFVLDFEAHTLNYFFNNTSTVLRGSIPLAIAVVSADKDRNEINIDSGAEVWNLRAPNRGAFVMWCQALSQAGETQADNSVLFASSKKATSSRRPAQAVAPSSVERAMSQLDKNLWHRLDQVFVQLQTHKDALRGLTVDETFATLEISDDRRRQRSPTRSFVSDTQRVDHSCATASTRKTFWSKRKPSDLLAPSSSTEDIFNLAKANNAGVGALIDLETKLETTLQTFRGIIGEHRLLLGQNTKPSLPMVELAVGGRKSFDSTYSADDVYEDALSGFEEGEGIIMVHRDPETDSDIELDDEEPNSDADSLSEIPSHASNDLLNARDLRPTMSRVIKDLSTFLDTTKRISRRVNVPAITDQPPSALKLISQKVGSDVSGMSVPAASNEASSLLQRVAEDLEYSELLDSACNETFDSAHRLLIVAAFAVSFLSSVRHKERAKRKPFNPMLGETYELIREDKGFCFLAEKVQHRPVTGIASHAESRHWSFQQYQSTTQKFYGKSMVLTTEGITKVKLRTGDVYVWEKPVAYLRNASWGEKWLEPSGDMKIRNLTTGEYAVVRFKAMSTFSSARSEELTIDAFAADGEKQKVTATGNWTSDLSLSGKNIWTAGPLLPNADQHCGLTVFAAQLNEVTAIESDKLPLTDSRRRPDLRAREEGRLDDSERHKINVEEGQRARRAQLESSGQSYRPRFFQPSENALEWEAITGEQSYWSGRENGWTEVLDLFGVEQV